MDNCKDLLLHFVIRTRKDLSSRIEPQLQSYKLFSAHKTWTQSEDDEDKDSSAQRSRPVAWTVNWGGAILSMLGRLRCAQDLNLVEPSVDTVYVCLTSTVATTNH